MKRSLKMTLFPIAALVLAVTLLGWWHIRLQEVVMFRLTSEQLFRLGVTQVEQQGRFDWAVAWSDDSQDSAAVISQALQPEHIGAFGSCDLGRCGWYVPREDFFRARKALLLSKEVAARKVQVTEPKLRFL